METQFNYIIELARKYQIYNDQPDQLFKAINELPTTELDDVFKEYGGPDRKFQPVALLRAELARRRLNGEEITTEMVEEIKERIRQREREYFATYPNKLMEEMAVYPMGKRDIFASWQGPWRIFHTFIYRGFIKETTQNYLAQIAKQMLNQLHLEDYTYHAVDFYGPQNFGDKRCWIVLFPLVKQTHKEAYQFMLLLSDSPEAGIMSGSKIKEKRIKELESVDSFASCFDVLQNKRETILKLNKERRDYFKFAPGPQAIEWERFKTDGIAAVNFDDLHLRDISEVKSREELNIQAGLPEDSWGNHSWNLWLFKEARQGDIIFASKGLNTCLGIGIIDAEYYFQKDVQTYAHRRKINWITDKIYHYKANTLKRYKSLFRPDTFSPTLVWGFILNEYIRIYPELAPIFEKYNLPFSTAGIKPSEVQEPATEYDAEEEHKEVNFWWINANPTIWSISSYKVGDRQTYTARNEKGNKRRIYKHFETVQPGDLMIGYESTPVKQVKALLEITKALHISEEEGEVIEFEVMDKMEVPIHWNELQHNPGLQACEVFINNQGSLFMLTEEEFDIIQEIIDNKNIIQERQQQTSKIKEYRYTEDPENPFIPDREFQQAVALLKRKKNIILQGPPGSGKTFIARKLAYEMMGKEQDSQIEMVQFHQSYSYEDFIQGLRPGKSHFELKNGIFYNFCQKAHAHPDRQFFFIIDEINRGNLSKIFGELLMLIEPDKRKKKFAIKLTYAEDDADTFYIKDNLHIIGTMNTADRSLAIVDYALRRRFAFITLIPHFGDAFKDFLSESGVSQELINHICYNIPHLNKQISDDINLGAGFQVGHSYFCTYPGGDDRMWYEEVVQFEIRPLLEEIWFDDPETVKKILDQLSIG